MNPAESEASDGLMEGYAIETSALTKSYGHVTAVSNLNLHVKSDSVTAFLGLNGAGKTTTIRMLLGMVQPTSGNGFVLGHRISDPTESVALRRSVAFVGERKPLYDYMTVGQIIRFTRSFYSDWDTGKEQKLARQFALPLQRSVRSLSKGMRTKLALLLAFARNPRLIILDEPSEGLDPIGIEQLFDLLKTLRSAGTAVFFSSHQIPEVERIAEYICILHKGRLVIDTSIYDLHQHWRQISIVLDRSLCPDEYQLRGVVSLRTTESGIRLISSSGSEEILGWAREKNAISIQVEPVPLRTLFLEMAREHDIALV
jgi:ABC-2 type transport system ATP-binding protein